MFRKLQFHRVMDKAGAFRNSTKWPEALAATRKNAPSRVALARPTHALFPF